MNKLVFLYLAVTLGFLGQHAIAQIAPAAHAAPDTTAITSERYWAIGKGALVTICEVMPAYIKRNKKDSLQNFIQQHLQWPKIGARMQIEGKVLVSCIVGTNGNIYRLKVVKTLHPAFDAEALRVVKLLNGHFSPAICGGVARPHEMVVPFYFAIK